MESGKPRPARPKSRQSLAHPPSRSDLNALEKQNATLDLASLKGKQDTQQLLSKKRTRGKSLGPGGIEALTESDGNAVKIKSILKPTIPITPPKNIPSFDELRKRNVSKSKSPLKSTSEDLLIDFSTPGPNRDPIANTTVAGTEAVADPFSPFRGAGNGSNDENVKPEGMDEEQKRQAEKKAILERRAARRKSMANRRVLFAPEATLHTWSVMELVEDSTTSSAANSTRRQSSITATTSPSKLQGSEIAPELPVLPYETSVAESPVKAQETVVARDQEMLGSELEDVYSSSPSGDVVADSSPVRIEDGIDSESDTDGDTAMSMDEMTSDTMDSRASGSSTHSSLDERLRQAASQAGTRGIEYDEYGDDVSMEIANNTVTSAFQPWVEQQQMNPDAIHKQADQENINPWSTSKDHLARQEITHQDAEEEEDTQGMTMDMTRAIGGIIESVAKSPKSRRKSVASRRRSSVAGRKPVGDDSSIGDESMEFTTVAGGILSNGTDDQDDQAETDDDVSESGNEATMEFTTAVGVVYQSRNRRESSVSIVSDGNDTMEMTAAIGGILPPIEEATEPRTEYGDETVTMNFTHAAGAILDQHQEETSNHTVEAQVVADVVYPTLGTEQKADDSIRTPSKTNSPPVMMTTTSETGSPSLMLKPRSSARPKRSVAALSTTPKSAPRLASTKPATTTPHLTPTKDISMTPSKAMTPQRTPVNTSAISVGTSAKKLFKNEIQARSSPNISRKDSEKRVNPLFSQDNETGHQTPRVVLHAPKPHQHLRRRSSGLGIDKDGFGSPRVSQILDRRVSIGETAKEFAIDSSQRGKLRFEDPQEIEQQLDLERAEDERRESGRFVMELETNGQSDENTTLQLKDMIQSMSPKKGKQSVKLKGRKSLAVGSAKGLLGKRPIELDHNEDVDGETTPKRLKAVSREASPVKKIHLPKPPTKEETTGRLTRSQQLMLDDQCGSLTPKGYPAVTQERQPESPQVTGRFKDLAPSTNRPTSFEDKMDNVIGAVDVSVVHPPDDESAQEEKISLQQFLNMTNIHFIELSTTKRRQTIAQPLSKSERQEEQTTNFVESCFVSASTVMPLLELYQHATRELKSYISEGRKIVRSIEAETLIEQPVLFREYIDARPDVKAIMDNQFRNGKTNARLQSKDGWYSWRSQLVDGLYNGLQNIKKDMMSDVETLKHQQASMSGLVAKLMSTHQQNNDSFVSLKARLEQLDSIDHEALRSRRQVLHSTDRNLEEKRNFLSSLQQQMQEKDEALSSATELKSEMQDQIAEANRVREGYRGWSAKDALSQKVKVDAIKKKTGWALIDAEEDVDYSSNFGTALTMVYKDEVKLYFYPSAYLSANSDDDHQTSGSTDSISKASVPISLTRCIDGGDSHAPDALSTCERFFLQILRGQLHSWSISPQESVEARTILQTISSSWDMAKKMSEEIDLLSVCGVTRVTIHTDDVIKVKLMLVTKDSSRVDFNFTLSVTIDTHGTLSTATAITVAAIYGPLVNILDAAKSRKVINALNKEISGRVFGTGAWNEAIQAYEKWHSTQIDGQARRLMEVQASTKKAAPKQNVTVSMQPPASPTKRVMTQSTESTTPPSIKATKTIRSPLAMKRSTALQKRAIPVPTSRKSFKDTTLLSTSLNGNNDNSVIADGAHLGKENQIPTKLGNKFMMSTSDEKYTTDTNGDNSSDGNSIYPENYSRPAITPEMQEAMMQSTPIKRIGALRRSPI